LREKGTQRGRTTAGQTQKKTLELKSNRMQKTTRPERGHQGSRGPKYRIFVSHPRNEKVTKKKTRPQEKDQRAITMWIS